MVSESSRSPLDKATAQTQRSRLSQMLRQPQEWRPALEGAFCGEAVAVSSCRPPVEPREQAVQIAVITSAEGPCSCGRATVVDLTSST